MGYVDIWREKALGTKICWGFFLLLGGLVEAERRQQLRKKVAVRALPFECDLSAHFHVGEVRISTRLLTRSFILFSSFNVSEGIIKWKYLARNGRQSFN